MIDCFHPLECFEGLWNPRTGPSFLMFTFSKRLGRHEHTALCYNRLITVCLSSRVPLQSQTGGAAIVRPGRRVRIGSVNTL